MKHPALLLLLALVGQPLRAQEAEPAPLSAGIAGPAIAFVHTEFDFGDVPFGGNGEHTFVFTNTGSQPLLLSNVITSCGCAAPSWSREPVLPAQQGEVKVRYNTHIVGPFSRTVVVHSNAEPPTVSLRVKGRVLPQSPQPAAN